MKQVRYDIYMSQLSLATLWFYAAFTNDEPMLDALQQFYKEDIDHAMSNKWVTPLGFAARMGKLAVVKRLLAAGADVNKSDEKTFSGLISE
jgi:hypothetical protein